MNEKKTIAAYMARIGARGGRGARGDAKARTTEQARRAAKARWDKKKKGTPAHLIPEKDA